MFPLKSPFMGVWLPEGMHVSSVHPSIHASMHSCIHASIDCRADRPSLHFAAGAALGPPNSLWYPSFPCPTCCFPSTFMTHGYVSKLHTVSHGLSWSSLSIFTHYTHIHIIYVYNIYYIYTSINNINKQVLHWLSVTWFAFPKIRDVSGPPHPLSPSPPAAIAKFRSSMASLRLPAARCALAWCQAVVATTHLEPACNEKILKVDIDTIKKNGDW